jgi:hypothetical protein
MVNKIMEESKHFSVRAAPVRKSHGLGVEMLEAPVKKASKSPKPQV